MRILIIRHAEPDYSKDSLTEKGFYEADCLAERLKNINIKNIYCSPMGRSRATIKPLVDEKGIEEKILPWLHEFNGKIFLNEKQEKICWDLMPQDICEARKNFSRDNWKQAYPYNTGNAGIMYGDIVSAFYSLLEKHGYKRENGIFKTELNNDDIIVLCCHFALGAVLISALTEIAAPLLWQGFFLAPSSVTSFVTEEREQGKAIFRCEYMGDISHLYKKNEPMSSSGMYSETFSPKVITGSLV